MRKKRTVNLRLSERGVVRYGATRPVVVIWLKDASEPDRPQRFEMSVEDALELAERLTKAWERSELLSSPEVEVIR